VVTDRGYSGGRVSIGDFSSVDGVADPVLLPVRTAVTDRGYSRGDVSIVTLPLFWL
jgi:hypothetical protein